MRPLVEQRSQVVEHYSKTLEEFGLSPRGVDWSSLTAMEVRFQKLSEACALNGWPSSDLARRTVLDYGSGLSHLFEWLTRRSFEGTYWAYDIVPTMLAASEKRYGRSRNFKTTKTLSALSKVDAVWLSGVFNVKGETSHSDWLHGYMTSCLEEILDLTPGIVAMNFLRNDTAFPSPRPTLFHTNPREVVEWLTGTARTQPDSMSCSVQLLDGYGLNEFTVSAMFWRP